MPQATESSPSSISPSSPASPSFAGLLAALTTPAPKTAWNNDDLADDVATLSYEHALRTHARYKSADPGDWAITQPGNAEPSPAGEVQDDSAPARTQTLWTPPGWSEEPEPQSGPGLSTMLDRNLKCASITIRLSKAECDQLRKRAADAGLTVSAYLRSCTFEAEALRTQVKEALAELRQATSTGSQGTSTAERHSWFGWLLRLVPHWHTDECAARG